MDSNPSQYSKAVFSIDVTLFGMIILFKEEQPRKLPFSMVASELLKVICDREVHHSKASSTMVVTLLGIITSVIPEQS